MDNNEYDFEQIKREMALDDIGLNDIDFNSIDLDAAADENMDASAPIPKKQNRSGSEIFDWVQCIISAVLLVIMLFLFVGRVIGVDGNSMYPTLHDYDEIITTKLFYTPKNGDIIVFRTEYYGDNPLVKRVIATAGQTVDIDFEAGVVYVDGEALADEYTNTPTNLREDFTGPITVPEGFIFVMGDNRNDSTDSRSARVGLVDTRNILGKVYLVAIPGIDKNTHERVWRRIGSPYN